MNFYILVHYSNEKTNLSSFAPRARLNLAKSVNHKQNVLLAIKNGNDYIIVSLRDALQTKSLLSISPSPHWEVTNSVIVPKKMFQETNNKNARPNECSRVHNVLVFL